MNLDWLHRNRVSYKCYPYSDKPTLEYYWGWYYENGTDERYNLFRYGSKIKSLKALFWHLSVIYWINSNNVRKYEPISNKKFKTVCHFISDKENGFLDFYVTKQKATEIYSKILINKSKPQNNSVKFVFKEGSGLSFKEKMSIVGSLSSSATISERDVKDAIKKIHTKGQKATNKSLSLILNCSEKTVQRHLTNELKKLKIRLNDEVVQQRKLPKI